MMPSRGSVLLVSLVLLLVLTVAGLAVIDSVSLEEKVTANYQDQQRAFYAAEAALLEAERWVQNTDVAFERFSTSCSDGLCFSGRYPEDVSRCQADSVFPWGEPGLWDDGRRVREVSLALADIAVKARYIIEFRCYLPREADGPDADLANRHDWSWFFRITARASGSSGQSRVMLQSTYKKNTY